MTHRGSEVKNKKSEIKNPGTLMNLDDKCTNIFPRMFDGLRIMVYRNLSQSFRVSHNIYFSSVTPGNYRFGVTYVGKKHITSNESTPVMLGDIDSSGNMNSQLYHLFGSRFKVSFVGQMEKMSFVSSYLTTHYLGDTFTASAILSDADIINNSGGLVLQYLQNVTPNLALGTELVLFHNLYNKTETESQVAVVGRYSAAHTVWCSNVSLNHVQLSCYKQASDQLEFGIELKTNFRLNESVGTLAYKINLPDRGIEFRASVDTHTNIGSVFQKRICGSPFSISVSANLNHKASNFRLGLGFTVE